MSMYTSPIGPQIPNMSQEAAREQIIKALNAENISGTSALLSLHADWYSKPEWKQARVAFLQNIVDNPSQHGDIAAINAAAILQIVKSRT